MLAESSTFQVWDDTDGVPVASAQWIGSRCWLRLDGIARFAFEADSGPVLAVPEDGCEAERIEDAYSRSVLPIVLSGRGRQVLHASAVLIDGRVVGFCAVSGTGKTTTTVALARLGHPIWTDDALEVHVSKGICHSLPLPFATRLRRPSAAYFLQASAVSSIGDPVPYQLPAEPHPVSALFVLVRIPQDAQQPAVIVERLGPGKALHQILTHAYYLDLDDAGRRQSMLHGYLDIVTHVPVFALHFQPSFDHLPRLTEAIETTVRSLTPTLSTAL